jgi:hypothetical protein
MWRIKTKNGKGIMEKRFWPVLIAFFLVFSFRGMAHSWQGRIAGMGDPFGLIVDESDFLIHPAEIADGKGVNVYGNYCFNWQNVTDWNYTAKYFDIATGALIARFSFRTSGDEQKHDTLVGAALPSGPGRLGVLFQYTDGSGDFNGEERYAAGILGRYAFDDNLDVFALRALYGLPMGSFKVGGEVQLAYQKAKNEDVFAETFQVFRNDIIGTHIPYLNTFPFQFPYDSKWWEMLFKGSLEGPLGPGKLSFTGRGGFIFSGDNELHFRNFVPAIAFVVESINFDGNVDGWKIGGDLWWRTPLKSGLSLPLLLKVDYNKKIWDGKGINVAFTNLPVIYRSHEKNLQVEAGGGLDKDFGKGARAAAGLYYNYSDCDRSFFYQYPFQKTDHTDYPLQKEHRVLLKVAGEKEFPPSVTARLGLNFFYGWVDEDYRFRETYSFPGGFVEHISMDGSHWGVGASLGGTIKLSRVNLEPFISGGYQRLGVDGDGGFRGTAIGLSMDKLKEEWSLGAGFSIEY